MRHCPAFIVLAATFIAGLGCGTSPTAPQPPRRAEFDPTALFAKLAGPYSLTFEADENCPLPVSLKTLTYDVRLEPTQFRYLAVLVPGEEFVGDLWALAREEAGFTFRWNVDCEAPDTVGSTSFYLCGQAAAFVSDGTIAGAIGGNVFLDQGHRPFCTNASHRFVFQRTN